MSPTELASGAHVEWAEGTGRVITVHGVSLAKAAGSDESDAYARVRLFRNGQPTDEVRLVPVDQLEKAAGAAAPAHGITADTLDAHLTKFSDHERAQMATEWFRMTGPKLPSVILGAEGAQTIVGVDQAGNGLA